jgi:hypothetical protein
VPRYWKGKLNPITRHAASLHFQAVFIPYDRYVFIPAGRLCPLSLLEGALLLLGSFLACFLVDVGNIGATIVAATFTIAC